jgi:two-component system OmpR family response regulator
VRSPTTDRAQPTRAVVRVGSLTLDPGARRVRRGGSEISLSPRELALLEALMTRPGVVLSRFRLREEVWGDGASEHSNVVDVYVRYLREKIDRPFGCDSIETVRGVGYRLRREEDS